MAIFSKHCLHAYMKLILASCLLVCANCRLIHLMWRIILRETNLTLSGPKLCFLYPPTIPPGVLWDIFFGLSSWYINRPPLRQGLACGPSGCCASLSRAKKRFATKIGRMDGGAQPNRTKGRDETTGNFTGLQYEGKFNVKDDSKHHSWSTFPSH